jgi:hypothetical protein
LGGEERLLVFDVSSGAVELAVSGEILDVAGSPALGLVAFTVIEDTKTYTKLWNAEKPGKLIRMVGGPPMAFVPGIKLLACCVGKTNQIRLHDCHDGSARGLLPDSSGLWREFRIDQTGSRLAAIDRDGRVCVWEIGERRARMLGTLTILRACDDAAFMPDGETMAAIVPRGKTVRFRRPNGTNRAIGCPPAELVFWRFADGKVDKIFSPKRDGKTLHGSFVADYWVQGGEDITVWDMQDLAAPRVLWQDRWRLHPWIPLE